MTEIFEQITIDEILNAINNSTGETKEIHKLQYLFTIETEANGTVKSLTMYNKKTKKYTNLLAKKYEFVLDQIKLCGEISATKENGITYLKIDTAKKPHIPVAYGYARCSTNEDKQSVDYQVRELMNKGISKENIYFDYASGKDTKRDGLQELMGILKSGDTLAFTEQSRLSRDVKDTVLLIDELKQKQIKVIVGDAFTLDYRPNGIVSSKDEGMMYMLAICSQWEREHISMRVKQGLETAKSKGKKLGRPIGADEDKLDATFKELYKSNKLSPKAMPKRKIHQLTGLSRVTIDKYFKILDENPDLLK